MIQHLLATIYTAIARLFTMGSTATLAVVPVRRRRGATFIEYALLAAIALAVFLALGGPLSNLMTGIVNKIKSTIGA